MNAIDASGALALATRLQRLADTLRKDGQLIYKAFGIHFEPKWFPVVYTLFHKPGLSVVELAIEIGYAHPSTISLLKELTADKIIRSKKDPQDERKRLLYLTRKGEELVDEMRPVWTVMSDATLELIDTTNNLLKAVAETEARFREKSFFMRAQPKLPKANN